MSTDVGRDPLSSIYTHNIVHISPQTGDALRRLAREVLPGVYEVPDISLQNVLYIYYVC